MAAGGHTHARRPALPACWCRWCVLCCRISLKSHPAQKVHRPAPVRTWQTWYVRPRTQGHANARRHSICCHHLQIFNVSHSWHSGMALLQSSAMLFHLRASSSSSSSSSVVCTRSEMNIGVPEKWLRVCQKQRTNTAHERAATDTG